MHPFRRLLPAAILLIIISGIGIAGYYAIEGWTLLDGTYMVVITLFTIGFEEVHRLSPVGKMFTIFLIISGVGTAIYIAGQAVEIIVEGEIFGYQRKKRMVKEIAGMKNHYIICGYGRVGHEVARSLPGLPSSHLWSSIPNRARQKSWGLWRSRISSTTPHPTTR